MIPSVAGPVHAIPDFLLITKCRITATMIAFVRLLFLRTYAFLAHRNDCKSGYFLPPRFLPAAFGDIIPRLPMGIALRIPLFWLLQLPRLS